MIEYLCTVYKKPVKLSGIIPLKSVNSTEDPKGFGYGIPYLLEFTVEGQAKRVVLETLRPEGFGHDDFSDRAAILLWQHSAFNRLPKHVHSIDVGSFASDCETLRSLGDCCEFFLLTDFVDGTLYHEDLDRMKEVGEVTSLDEERCLTLSDYLVEIHSVRNTETPGLYVRRIRDLVGHGEAIFGLTDSYPDKLPYVGERFFVDFEKICIDWRWRLRQKTHRLSRVHGDFHPWNIMFRQGMDFTVLDRSRGEWGEPADDLAALSINYLLYALHIDGKIEGPLLKLFMLFWRNYLDKTGDEEVLNVVQPFFAWRSLVIASPLWYPDLTLQMRSSIFKFSSKVLRTKIFEFEDVEHYFR